MPLYVHNADDDNNNNIYTVFQKCANFGALPGEPYSSKLHGNIIVVFGSKMENSF